MSCFIIAEAGVNHNGDEQNALKMVDVAKQCGADAIKFQTFKTENVIFPGVAKAEYQRRETGEGDQFSMIKRLEMSRETHIKVAAHCQAVGIEFMSTPFDYESVDFLLGLGMKTMKVASGEITNLPFLTYLASKNLPLIVSTGMANMDEIKLAVETIAASRDANGFTEPLADVLTILHCTSNYPAACKDVNLRAMTSIAEQMQLPVGYSDHTLGVAVSTAAVARGACVIEKHFTLDKNMEGPDHSASLTPAELAQMVGQIRDVELALGSDIKQPTESELPVRSLVRRSVTVLRDLAKGHVLTEDDIALMRPGTGIAPKDFNATVGRTLAKDVTTGTTLMQADLE